MNLNVKEIFYSLQGEGGRQGEASVFIRLTNCNLNCDFCDTDFEGGIEMTLSQILSAIKAYPCEWIIWTGGEPTLQLTDEALLFFRENGYKQAIESNGLKKLSSLLDYTVISPKTKLSYIKEINPCIDELRLPVQEGQQLPPLTELPEAKFYFLSPVFEQDKHKTQANISYCVEQIKQKADWRLSLQIHKLIGIE